MKTTLLALILLILPLGAAAQEQPMPTKVGKDSTIVFGTPALTTAPGHEEQKTFANSIGADLMVSAGGFGAGLFYRHEYTEDLSGFVGFSISEAKDDDEVEYIDYFGNRYTYGKINRFLVIPLSVGVQQRLFRDDILDNFRPYITAGAGPTLIYVFPYNEEYFSALGKGQLKYTAGGYVGIGAFFGSERSNLLGLNVRYYYVPYPAGLESLQNTIKTQFGGIYISFTFGSAW